MASILFHSKFQAATLCVDISYRREKSLCKLYLFGNSSGMHSEQAVLSRLGNHLNQSAQFLLERNILFYYKESSLPCLKSCFKMLLLRKGYFLKCMISSCKVGIQWHAGESVCATTLVIHLRGGIQVEEHGREGGSQGSAESGSSTAKPLPFVLQENRPRGGEWRDAGSATCHSLPLHCFLCASVGIGH